MFGLSETLPNPAGTDRRAQVTNTEEREMSTAIIVCVAVVVAIVVFVVIMFAGFVLARRHREQ